MLPGKFYLETHGLSRKQLSAFLSEFPCLRRKRKAWNCQSFCNWNLSTLKAKGKAKIASKSRTVEVTFYLWQLESHPAFTVISFPLHSPFKSTFEVKLCLQQLHEFLKQEEEAKRCKSIFMLCFLFLLSRGCLCY